MKNKQHKVRWEIGGAEGRAEAARVGKEITKLKSAVTRSETAADKDAEVVRLHGKREQLMRDAGIAHRRLQTAQDSVGSARGQARREVLAEIRSMGGSGMKYDLPDDNGHVKSMLWAEDQYPEEWLQHAKLTSDQIKLVTTGRGKYSNGNPPTITLSGYGDEDSRRVAVHELGHHMEVRVPGLLEAERAYYWSRTSKGPLGRRRREGKSDLGGMMAGEKTRRDTWPSKYTGKNYEHSFGRGHWEERAFEVFTTGVESMFAGSQYLDNDFEDFMMGVMATL